MANQHLQTITCKGAVCWGPGEPMTIEMIQVDPPRASEVRIRILYASICHTDLSRWHGRPFPLFPRILGHEGVGVVEGIGEEVQGFQEGDLVIPTFIGECQECLNCKSGKTNFCMKYPVANNAFIPDESTRMSVKGQRVYPLFACSTFCEYTVVNVNYLVKIDSRVSLPHASVLSCGFSTGFGVVWKEAKVDKNSTVAVFGLGGVGIGAVAAAKIFGARKIIGVDINENKKEKSLSFGMTDFINSKNLDGKSIPEAIFEANDGVGVDYSFDCCGADGLLNEALESTSTGTGLTLMLGVPKKPLQITARALLQGRTVKGSIFGGIKPQSDLPTIFEKCINKEFDIDEILTHRSDLNNINDAFELLKDPHCMKVLLKIAS